MAELADRPPPAAAITTAMPACCSFPAGLWLLWIGVGALNEALLDGVLWLLDSQGPVGIPFLLLLGPIAVTLEWLVLRRAWPGLPWLWWFFASALAGFMTFLGWVTVMISEASTAAGGIVTPEAVIVTLIMGTLGSAVLAFALASVAGRYPLAFFLCAIIAAFVVPLDVAIEHGPIRHVLSRATNDLSAIASWLNGPGFRFLPFRPVMLLPDSYTVFLMTQALGRIAANALGAAVTGFGLWRLCGATRDPLLRRLHQIGK